MSNELSRRRLGMSNFSLLARDLPVSDLAERLSLLPELWDLTTYRQEYEGTAHGDSKTIFVRGPVSTDNVLDCIDCYQDDLIVLELAPLAGLMDAIDQILGIQFVGRVMLVKIPPGGKVLPHRDTGAYARFFARFHCVIQGRCEFFCDGEQFNPTPGDLFTFNHQITHSVAVPVTEDAVDRIHLIFDAAVPGFTGALWRSR
ncbi:MAG: AraC family ligand binding domain-containing protein [Gemmatimonadales bacterium]|nr:AraC family ligand binding domain-containing protein [Gemmatimonadales bacterium]